MKIAIVCEYLSYVGGGERVYCSWANMFSDNLGYDVTIVSMEDCEKTFYTLSPNVRIKSLRLRKHMFYQNPAKRRRDMVLKYLSDREKLKKYLQYENFDIVIGIALNINLILASINGPFIKIATEHSEYYAPSRWLRCVRNRLYSNFHALTVLNKTDLDLFRRYNTNCKVMLNPVEALTLNLYPSNLNEKLIISVGSLSPQKNQSDLISMMGVLHKEYPDWKLKIFGEGPLRETLEKQISDLNLNNVIELSGVTSNVPKEIRKGSIFVLSSNIEGFGLVLIEAMSVGVPCVSYNSSGPNMIIKDGFNGILIPKNDLKSLIESVRNLISNNQLRKIIGQNALLSSSKYHPKNVAKDWSDLINSLLKPNKDA